LSISFYKPSGYTHIKKDVYLYILTVGKGPPLHYKASAKLVQMGTSAHPFIYTP